LRHHVGIAIDAETLNVPFPQAFEKNAGTAPKIQNPRALLEHFEICVMPSPQIVVLFGRPVEERKPLPTRLQRTKIRVAQET
jgi:hypothetical protein